MDIYKRGYKMQIEKKTDNQKRYFWLHQLVHCAIKIRIRANKNL